MQYRKDVHRYRKVVRKRQRAGRIRGVVLIALSFALMLYAIPCFATSVWDMDSTSHSNALVFSTDVKEDKYSVVEDEETAAASLRPASELSISETVGPGVLSDDGMVDAAKRRAEAVTIAQSELNSQLAAKEIRSAEPQSASMSTAFATIAMVLSLFCAAVGAWNIMRSRTVKGIAIAEAYSSALRAV